MNDPISAAVDTVNGVIRGVSVITSGIVARGHDLEIDGTTLSQMKACAEEKGQIPCRIDHKSGAGSTIGWLTNFQIAGNKLVADWFLLQTHPQRDQLLETAQRCPSCLFLSAAFLAPEKAERAKSGRAAARCRELLSVDLVAQGAANPDGVFASINGNVVEFSVPSDPGARIREILFGRNDPALHRVIDSTRDNLPDGPSVPPEVGVLRRVARTNIARRAALKALKIGTLAGIGAVAAHKTIRRAKAGAAAGAIAGILFSAPESRRSVALGIKYAESVTTLS